MDSNTILQSAISAGSTVISILFLLFFMITEFRSLREKIDQDIKDTRAMANETARENRAALDAVLERSDRQFQECNRLWLDNQDKWIKVVRELTELKSKVLNA